LKLEKGRGLQKDEFETKIMMIDDAESESEAEDINIDEYLSNDETPDYKTNSNYSDDDDDRETPFALK
jgi:RNA polymerase sigma-54 factor